MRIFNYLAGFGLVSGLTGLLLADDLILSGASARLTGSVRSISGEGIVELASPLSEEPILLKSGAVKKIDFSTIGAAPEPPSALVELTNGDFLPVTVEGFDDKKLTVVSPGAGRLEIPREALLSAQLGIQRRKMAYSGPQNLEEWIGEGDAKNWGFERAGLVANGPATAMKKIALPRQFALRFTLKWQPRMIPNLEVYFADPLMPKGEACDRYFLRFNSAGLEIKREAATGKHFTTIVQLNRTPNQYTDQRLQVEIQVDRVGARMKLFLNGEPEGEFVDPVESVPTGSGIKWVCNAQTGNPHEIHDIEIYELNDSHARHRAEERGDPKNDSLISREDDRWGGRLTEIRKSAEGAVFVFKGDFQNEPLEIPEADVSTVFFSGTAAEETEKDPPPYLLRLPGEGSLRVKSCRFSEDAVEAVHPLLGPLNFRRDGILSMERIDPKPEPAPE